MKAMEEEMKSLINNDTWDLVGFLDGRKEIGAKWVFKINTNASTHIESFKARLVAKGYLQVKGVNFNEIFSPIGKLTSIRILMSLLVAFNLKIEKMDVKITFPHGYLKEGIYMLSNNKLKGISS